MHKKLVIFDMDGTVYLGKDLFDGALETFQYLKDNHIDFVFFTNNSSHDLEFYHQKMTAFGLDCDLKKNFYSSTEVTISHLLKLGVKDIYVIGNKKIMLKGDYNEIVKNDNELAKVGIEIPLMIKEAKRERSERATKSSLSQSSTVKEAKYAPIPSKPKQSNKALFFILVVLHDINNIISWRSYF